MIAAAVLAISQALAPPAPVTAPAQGVVVYGPEFFAGGQAANALDMIDRTPGFTLQNGDSVRGFEGAAGNVLIDGQRPTTKSEDLDEVLKRIPISQVARIELIRGGAPGIDMQGRPVLANVVRKTTGGINGVVQLQNKSVYDGRQHPALRLELTGGANGRKWEASAVSSEGLDDGAGVGPGTRVDGQGRVIGRSHVSSNGDVFEQTLTGAYEQPVLGGRFRVNGRLYWEKYKYEEDSSILFPVPGRASNDYDADEFKSEIGGRWTRDFGARTSLDLIGLRQTEDEKTTSVAGSSTGGNLFAQDRHSSETIARLVLKRRQSERLSFEVGGEGALNKLNSQSSYAENGASIALPAADVGVEERRGEAFAKAVWRPWSPLTLEGGLRFEASSIRADGDLALKKSLSYAKPRLTAAWAVDGQTQIRARFERTVSQLDFDDFVAESTISSGAVHAGNPDLVPEQALVSEAAIERRFWKDGSASITLRHSALSDVVDRAPVFAPGGQIFDAPSNIGDGTKDELIAEVTVPLAHLGLKGAQLKGQGTWRRSSVTDPTTGQRRPISQLHPLDWEAHFTQDLPAWKTTFGVDAFSANRQTYYRFDEIDNDKIKTFVVVYADYRPRPDVVVRVEVDNATSRGFRHTNYVYSGPRGTSPLAYVDDRNLQIGRTVMLRVRKTF
jgi:outer membrane receptor for ferrienterochelin and colicin